MALVGLAPSMPAGLEPPPTPAVALHPNSISSTRIRVDGTEILLTQRCQVLSLMEVIPDLDADGDGVVTPAEIQRSRDAVFDYLGRQYRLFVGSDRDREGGERLILSPLTLSRAEKLLEEGNAGFSAGAVDAVFHYAAAEPVTDLLVEMDLFLDTSPDHVDLLAIEWVGQGTESFGLDAREPRGRSDPTGKGAFVAFFRLGWGHILSGWDHLAFVLALVLASRRLRSLLGVVTAFTLAHSVTLALAALDYVDVSAWSTAIEAFIALSIAYVAADTALHPNAGRSRWIEAFAFGLVHGLGFASFLRLSLVSEPNQAIALFSFNVGVEAGQIGVVFALVASLAVLRRVGPAPEAPPRTTGGPSTPTPVGDFLAPWVLRRFGSAAIAVLGLFWFFARI